MRAASRTGMVNVPRRAGRRHGLGSRVARGHQRRRPPGSGAAASVTRASRGRPARPVHCGASPNRRRGRRRRPRRGATARSRRADAAGSGQGGERALHVPSARAGRSPVVKAPHGGVPASMPDEVSGRGARETAAPGSRRRPAPPPSRDPRYRHVTGERTLHGGSASLAPMARTARRAPKPSPTPRTARPSLAREVRSRQLGDLERKPSGHAMPSAWRAD